LTRSFALALALGEPLLLGGAGLGFVSDTEMAGLGLPRPILREHNPRHRDTSHITRSPKKPTPIRNNPVREFHRRASAYCIFSRDPSFFSCTTSRDVLY